MSLAIVFIPPDEQDIPLTLRNESQYLLCFTREQFDAHVDNSGDDIVIVNDPRED